MVLLLCERDRKKKGRRKESRGWGREGENAAKRRKKGNACGGRGCWGVEGGIRKDVAQERERKTMREGEKRGRGGGVVGMGREIEERLKEKAVKEEEEECACVCVSE